MYVEADVDRCNQLQFQLADGVLGTIDDSGTKGATAITTRTWDITVDNTCFIVLYQQARLHITNYVCDKSFALIMNVSF